jgi:hypothetical protein
MAEIACPAQRKANGCERNARTYRTGSDTAALMTAIFTFLESRKRTVSAKCIRHI